MARTSARPEPRHGRTLRTVRRRCPGCGRRMWGDYDDRRTVVTLAGLVRPRIKVRRCPTPACPRYRRPYRPAAEGALALPRHAFGLDVVALVGALRSTASTRACRRSTGRSGAAAWRSPSAP